MQNSKITLEVWLPDPPHWNGKFEGIGSSGLGGVIDHGAMLSGLLRGYATAATDTGHDNSTGVGTFAIEGMQKVIDYGYRSTHLAAAVGKSIAENYYARAPSLAYFSGCSQGGQEGMMEAQRFPADYDGIIAGDPDYNQTHHEVGAHLWISSILFSVPGRALSADKAARIGQAVNAACDGLDGVMDGVLEDPRLCHFDPAVLQCRGAEPAHCLTPQQVEVVRSLWRGPAETLGAGYYPGLERGGEAETWNGWIVSATPDVNYHAQLGLPFFRYFVYADPKWNIHSFDLKNGPAFIEHKLAAALNATDPDLRPFARRGGKLIHYHGFSDPDVPPRSSINYYETVTKVTGASISIDSFYRLFMVPGMGHCAGGPGANSFDMLSVLENWVEHRLPPNGIVATKYVGDNASKGVVRTHLLCPYPLHARYNGSGRTDKASNFSCSTEIGVGKLSTKRISGMTKPESAGDVNAGLPLEPWESHYEHRP